MTHEPTFAEEALQDLQEERDYEIANGTYEETGTMNERYTQKDVETAFKNFCTVTGLRHLTSYEDIGAYTLDKGYGGYQVVQMLKHGAQATPFGMRRHTAKEMVRMLQFAADVHRTTNQEQ